MLRTACLFAIVAVASAGFLDFRCPEKFGIFTDPDDCQSGYICFLRVPKQFTCDEGELFGGLFCRDQDRVDCEGRPNPYGEKLNL